MNLKMNNSDPSQTSDEQDEYPKVTQADLDRARFASASSLPRGGAASSWAEASQQRISHE
jgi:hypothetical protein